MASVVSDRRPERARPVPGLLPGPGRRLRSLAVAGLGACLGFYAVATATAAGGDAAELPGGLLTADQAVRIALERNYDVAIANASAEAARGQAWQALAGVLPRVSSSAAYSHTQVTGPAFVGGLPTVSTAESDERGLDVTLSQSLFSWANIQGLRSARAGSQSARELARSARLDVALAARTQYYELLKAQKLAEVRADAVDLSEDQLERAETLFELGSVARNDVLQARVNLQQARLAQIQVRNQVEIERGRLAELLGFPADTPIAIVDDIEAQAAAEIDSAGVLKEALAGRPELQAGAQNVSSALAGLSSARAGHWPELFGRVNWFWTYRPGSGFDPFSGQAFENDTNGWAGTAGVELNIFDGMLVEGRVKSARSNLARERHSLRQLELAVALEVKEAVLRVREAQQSIAAAREGVTLGEENLSLAQERYQVGAGTILELDEAQVSLIEARSALVDAQALLRVAEASLDRARGAEVD